MIETSKFFSPCISTLASDIPPHLTLKPSPAPFPAPPTQDRDYENARAQQEADM